jgi:hypothetical protein
VIGTQERAVEIQREELVHDAASLSGRGR